MITRLSTQKASTLSDYYLITSSGSRIDLIDMHLNEYRIEDIADALSKSRRWAGQTDVPFSVAQHSVVVSQQLPRVHQLAGLLHDASEAFLNDLPRPVKRLVPQYIQLEDELMTSIAAFFGFRYPLHAEVRDADNRMLSTEWRDLRKSAGDYRDHMKFEPFNITLNPVDDKQAKLMFIVQYNNITRGLKAA